MGDRNCAVDGCNALEFRTTGICNRHLSMGVDPSKDSASIEVGDNYEYPPHNLALLIPIFAIPISFIIRPQGFLSFVDWLPFIISLAIGVYSTIIGNKNMLKGSIIAAVITFLFGFMMFRMGLVALQTI